MEGSGRQRKKKKEKKKRKLQCIGYTQRDVALHTLKNSICSALNIISGDVNACVQKVSFL